MDRFAVLELSPLTLDTISNVDLLKEFLKSDEHVLILALHDCLHCLAMGALLALELLHCILREIPSEVIVRCE